MNSITFGQFIAQTRKEKNMTQADLAQIIGVTDKAVSRWERGIGFPDINSLEPLANALDITLLELMRSERSDSQEKKDHLSEGEATEIMANAVKIARENQFQDRFSIYLAAVITIVTAVLVYLSGHANIGASLLTGAIFALAVVAIYLLARNKADRESRKIYGIFTLIGIGIAIWLLHLIGVDSYVLVWGVFCIFSIIVWLMGR